ncbi:hypothetical protein [Streptomyces sp. NPDC046832]|uniref:hypothetical protein n=1 Tax=Streptomyces sp. NPDC046832 TaxID=3155020 RepID=UPI0033E034A6
MAKDESIDGGESGSDRQDRHRSKVEYPPVLNGADYLLEVVTRLSGEPTPRDLKYAVLHLQAGTEVLLKARLVQEHWSLVFSNPAQANWEEFNRGSLTSCTTKEAINRLRHIARVKIDDRAEKAITTLADTRNALQHYGLSMSAMAVEAQAAKVLDFLLTFINTHLLPHLNSTEAVPVEVLMVSIRQKVRGIEKLVSTRLNGLRDALAPYRDTTVVCPDCAQLALVIGEPISCMFCYQQWVRPQAAAEQYAWIVLGQDTEAAVTNGDPSPVRSCPLCTDFALVLHAKTAGGASKGTPLCFGCGHAFGPLIDCEGCGEVIEAPGWNDLPYCPECTTATFGQL